MLVVTAVLRPPKASIRCKSSHANLKITCFSSLRQAILRPVDLLTLHNFTQIDKLIHRLFNPILQRPETALEIAQFLSLTHEHFLDFGGLADNLIDQSVLLSLLSNHEIVAFGVLGHLFHTLTSVV